MGQSRLNITDTRAALGTRHRTKTNKAKNTTQKTKQIADKYYGSHQKTGGEPR
jgi:hypothetical protein